MPIIAGSIVGLGNENRIKGSGETMTVLFMNGNHVNVPGAKCFAALEVPAVPRVGDKVQLEGDNPMMTGTVDLVMWTYKAHGSKVDATVSFS